MEEQILKQKIGQLFAVGLPGETVSEEFRDLVRQYKVGNVILFSRNMTSKEQIRALTAELRELIRQETGQEPLIMTDEEGGVVSRLPAGMEPLPSAMAQASLKDPGLVREGSRRIGEELLDLGINMDLAPVADINNNRDNPIIGVRSFGEDADTVSAYALAAVKGYEEAGILSCAKHFPGHGDTKTDSHVDLPLLKKSTEELEELELIPFEKLIRGGAPAIMISHMAVPSITDGEKVPCTMSRSAVSGYLRAKMGFTGLVVSDCMEMEAVHTYFGTERGCVAALAAGIDLVLVSHRAELAARSIEAVYDAVHSGEILEEEIERAWGQVCRAKDRIQGQTAPCGAEEETNAFCLQFLEKTITPGAEGAAAFSLGEHPVYLAPVPQRLTQVADASGGSWTMGSLIAEKFGGDAFTCSLDPDQAERERILKSVKNASGIVLGTLNGHLYEGQKKLLKELEETGIPLAHAALRNPYDLDLSDKAEFKIALYEYSERSVQALMSYLI